MAELIEIHVPYDEILERRERVDRTRRFEQFDRVAVWPAINYRFLLPVIGIRFKDYYSNPEIMLRAQIQGQPCLMEINSLPGLTPGFSDLVVIANAEGISYQDLILEILYLGASRYGLMAPSAYASLNLATLQAMVRRHEMVMVR